MPLFNKDVACDKCRKTLPKKQLSHFDAAGDGKFKKGIEKKVCNDCAMELFYNNIRDFNDRAVVIYPMKKRLYNAYVYFRFDELIEITKGQSKQENIKLKQDFKLFLPTHDAKCSCGEVASYTWASDDIIFSEPYEWTVNPQCTEYKHLCKECLIKEFKMKLKELDIKIEYLMPAIKGNGFFIQWQL